VNTYPERDERDLALLLDIPDGSVARAEAERRLADEPAFRERFDALQEIARALEEVGGALQLRAVKLDLVSDVRDALSHLKWEAMAGLDRPFYPVERELEAAAETLEGLVPPVDLVAPTMDAVGAARKSDGEVDLSFAPLAAALNALGDEVRQAAPDVDLVAGVMARLSDTHAVPANVVPLRARPASASVTVPAARRAWWPYAALGAAALAVAGAWFTYQGQAPVPVNETMAAGGTVTPGEEPAAPVGDSLFERVPEHELDRLAENDPPPGDEGEVPSAPSIAAEPITLQEAINARRRALVNNVAAFEQLASLSPEQASRLLAEANLSLEALLGAAQFLSPEDAAALLRAAMANDPDNENIKYALARSLAGNPDFADERQRHLQDLVALNDNNSLPNYLLAADHMARGEMERGMDALSRGAAYAEADTYTLESMQQREAVLRASGLDADVARYLAVATGGEAGVSDIASLRQELLGYGAFYEGQGDLDTAQQIYNAVNQLGAQITEGADMAALRRAGLETQQDALYAIQGIAEILQQPEHVALLGNTLNVLAESIYEVSQYINTAQAVISNPQASSTDWSALIQHILTNGDVDITNLVGTP